MAIFPQRIPGLWSKAREASRYTNRGLNSIIPTPKNMPGISINTHELGWWGLTRVMANAFRQNRITNPKLIKQIKNETSKVLEKEKTTLKQYYLNLPSLKDAQKRVTALKDFALQYSLDDLSVACTDILERIAYLEQHGLPWTRGNKKVTLDTPGVFVPEMVTFEPGDLFTDEEISAMFSVEGHGFNRLDKNALTQRWHSVFEQLQARARREGPLRVRIERGGPDRPSRVKVLIIKSGQPPEEFAEFSIRKAIERIQAK